MGNDCKWCYGSILMYTQVLLASVIFKTPNVDLKPILKWAVSLKFYLNLIEWSKSVRLGSLSSSFWFEHHQSSCNLRQVGRERPGLDAFTDLRDPHPAEHDGKE